jgi:poly(3-hydroxybutyrate) depolymerase
VIYVFANAAGSPPARVCVTVTRAGVIMQLAGKRDALMPPNPEELLNRPQ